VLDPSLPNLDARAEVLLLLAARAQHVEEVIAPALAAGRDVVCDRFSGSTVAYQGYGRGLDPAGLERLSDWASGGVRPDRVVLLQVARDVARGRRQARGAGDRLEGEGADFFERVERGFADLARSDPARWRVVDGSGPVEEVAVRVLKAARFPK
jgi:dTMP kinase